MLRLDADWGLIIRFLLSNFVNPFGLWIFVSTLSLFFGDNIPGIMLLSQIPFGLLLLCQLVLFLDTSRGEQCRLLVNNNAALAPGGGNNPSQLPTPNVTASNGAPNPSSTDSSSGSSSSSTTATQIQPFNYGTDIIRGVNL